MQLFNIVTVKFTADDRLKGECENNPFKSKQLW